MVAEVVDNVIGPAKRQRPIASRPAVVGLDLSMTGTGIARADDTVAVVKATTQLGDERLSLIRQTVLDSVAGADLVVIEDLPTHAHGAGITGMVHGAVRELLIGLGVPYALVPPASLKRYATGRGNAPKPDLRMALYKRTGIDHADDNIVDATWLRYMGLDRLGHPPVALPILQHSAIDAVRWPMGLTA